MNKNLVFIIPLVISMVYGLSFIVIRHPSTAYVVIGAIVCAVAWVAAGQLKARMGLGRERARRPIG